MIMEMCIYDSSGSPVTNWFYELTVMTSDLGCLPHLQGWYVLVVVFWNGSTPLNFIIRMMWMGSQNPTRMTTYSFV